MKIVRQKIGKTFSEKVVALALSIPSGRVTTYGAIARAAGGGGQAARSVTAILGKAYTDGDKKLRAQIPFHRIVYAGGRVWLTDEYRTKRLALYKKEGVEIDAKGFIKDFDEKFFGFR